MSNKIAAPTDMCIITTYRCPMRCKMCDIWNHPTEKSQEIQPKELEILPHVNFVNITGGEPFVRDSGKSPQQPGPIRQWPEHFLFRIAYPIPVRRLRS